MAFYEITFSPTGGTKKVSGLFTEAYGAESTYIDLTDRTVDFAAYSFQEEDICAVSVPSYGGTTPLRNCRIHCRQRGLSALPG